MPRPLFVLLDPGHGGKDPGAVAFTNQEARLNLDAARLLAETLAAQGVRVSLTRHFDTSGPSLPERCAMESRLQPDLFLSLHCNAAANSQAHGLEVWTSPGTTRADEAATCLYEAMKQALPHRAFRCDFADGDPDQEARFYVLRNTACPAVLVEMGFLTNPGESLALIDKGEQLVLTDALAKGLTTWWSLNAFSGGAA